MDTNDQAPQHHPTFLELTDSDSSSSVEAPPSQPTGRLSKGERYDITRVERGINRRVRRDGTGKPAYEVKVWINSKALSKTFAGLQDARRWRDEMVGKRASGSVKIPSDRRIKVAEFVTLDWYTWLDEQVRFGNLRPSTASWYRDGARRLVNELGTVRVADIGKNALRGMLERLVQAGDSHHTLRHVRASTRSVLALAVDRDILERDPSEFMVGRNAPKALKRSNPKPKAWNEADALKFLHSVRGDRLETLWLLLLTSGLRRGESLALQWSDLDLDTATISISKALIQVGGVPTMSPPKTANSKRTIAIGRETVESLKAHRLRQNAERLASKEWVDGGYVFTRIDGSLMRPDQVYVAFKRLVDQAEVPWIRLHGLRHTMASLALQNGVDVATVSERLGHADVGITTRTYLHGSAESDRQAALTLDQLLAL